MFPNRFSFHFCIVAGVTFILLAPGFANGAAYTICEGVGSGEKKCVDGSKNEEVFYGQKLWKNCAGGYANLDDCKSAIGGPVEINYNLCYDITDPLNAQCITNDYSWWDSLKSASAEGYACNVIGWSPQTACEAELAKYIIETQKAQTIICCIPPKSKTSDVACAEVTANFSNKKEVDAKCATALGGDDNYQYRQQGKCSAANDCKNTGSKKKTGGGAGSADGTSGAAGTSGGSGVAPTSKPVGGGSFIIGNLTDPFGNFTVPTLIGMIIKSSLSVVGTIALVLFIYAGIMWMTASGNEERTRSSAKIMMWTVLGLVAIFASYILVTFVFSAL